MEITEEQLQRFIVLYENEFGVSLSPLQAQQSALSLLRLMVVSIKELDISDIDDIV